MAALMEFLPLAKSSSTSYYDHSNDSKNDEELDGDVVADDEYMQNEIVKTTRETKAALEKIVNVRLSTTHPKNIPKLQSSNIAKYMEYNSGAKKRVIRLIEKPVDPLEPPKHNNNDSVHKASVSPPVPVMHSPTRPVTVKDQHDWNIPPCISNFKNTKGYTIPLDKRLAAADGRGLREVQVNDNFPKVSEAMYVAEQKARNSVAMRNKVQKEIEMKENERKEQELGAWPQKVRSERIGVAKVLNCCCGLGFKDSKNFDIVENCGQIRPQLQSPCCFGDSENLREEEREEWLQWEKIRKERRRERERERRLEAKDAAMGKKRKITRDRDRDVSEKVDLGMASNKKGITGVMYDERLFNQDKGMSSGFATDDDQYNVYDQGLFTAQPTLSTLYRPKKGLDNEAYGGPRDRPVEFESEEADPFGLDQFLTEVKKGKKAMEKVGSGGGTMRASAAGSSMGDGYEGGSGRTRSGFGRGH